MKGSVILLSVTLLIAACKEPPQQQHPPIGTSVTRSHETDETNASSPSTDGGADSDVGTPVDLDVPPQ